jgi:Domain of unknown function (DUF1735).
MKKIIYLLCGFLFVGFTACNEEDFSAREHYKYMIYLLSENDYNVFSAEYDLEKITEEGEITAYLTVGCGGSLSNPEEFVVELEPDFVLFDKYNQSNFDIDISRYARLLPEDKYQIESNRVVFPANNADQYVKVPIRVRMEGLSPDSIYFIPIAIKSTSKYEVNKEKSAVLFRITMKNDYAEQLKDTYYQLRGNIVNEDGNNMSVSSSKLVRPLTKNSVRLYAGSNTQTIQTATVEEIKKYSIILTVDENNQVQITPYGTIEVEQLDGGQEWNKYEEAKTYADAKIVKRFYLYYRYRTLRSLATSTSPAIWDDWVTIKETLRRME